MDENHATGAPNRPVLLRRYMRALERGDIDAATAIVQLAETDAALERILIAANEVFLEQIDHIVAEIPSWDEDRPLKSVEASPEKFSDGIVNLRNRHRLGPRWLGAAVAIFLIAALLAGFFALFSGRVHFGQPAGEGTPQPTVISTVTQTHPTIVVATNDGDIHAGVITALNEDDGTIRWRQNSTLVDSLARSKDNVYVAIHPNTDGEFDGGGITLLTAFNSATGAQLWQTSEPQIQGFTYMFVDGNVLVVASGGGDGAVYGLDAKTGRTLWTQSPDLAGTGAIGIPNRLITATDGVAYILSRYGFDAFDSRSGKRLWSYLNGGGISIDTPNGPSVVRGADGLVYYYDTDPNSSRAIRVVALDATTGALKSWLFAADIGTPNLVTPDGTVYSIKDSQLCAFRVADSARLWCIPSDKYIRFGPTDSIRLVSTPTALLYFEEFTGSDADPHPPVAVGALSNSSGTQLWAWQGASSLFAIANASFTRQDNTLFLGTSFGMYAFRITDGTLLWHVLETSNLGFVQASVAG